MPSTSFYALMGEFSKKLTDLQKREKSMHEMDKSVEPDIMLRDSGNYKEINLCAVISPRNNYYLTFIEFKRCFSSKCVYCNCC